MTELRDLVLIGDTRDALASWVGRKTGDEKLAAEMRLLTPSDLLAKYHEIAERRRRAARRANRKKVSPEERAGQKLLRDLKAVARKRGTR